jgi:superoxide dismutase, Cu-Zn family
MRLALIAGVITTSLFLAGCHDHRCTKCGGEMPGDAKASHEHGAKGAHDHAAKAGDACAVPAALVAVMQPTKGNQTAGKVRFTQVPDGVRIVADITGLVPGQKHAIHIHEFGDIGAEDGSAAGGHYNPGGHPHGAPGSEHHHAGDLGNLTADAAGNAHYELVMKELSLCCGKMPVIGRSVIIHAKEDDLTSQPAGNAGPRIAQGVIGATK